MPLEASRATFEEAIRLLGEGHAQQALEACNRALQRSPGSYNSMLLNF